MNGKMQRPMAFGTMAAPHNFEGHKHGGHNSQPSYHGSFCKSCCHPVSKCCCCKECIKEPKELLVIPVAKKAGEKGATNLIHTRIKAFSAFSMQEENTDEALKMASGINPLNAGLDAANVAAGIGDAIIGGGCCVHLSIEYMQNLNESTILAPDVVSVVMVGVLDSEGTLLSWSKLKFPAGYHIKEGIITTNPGAKLIVVVGNAIARVRWCEIFSC